MTEPSQILCAEADGIARITLNRPEAGNSLSMELVSALRRELARIAQLPAIKVIVLAGMGGRIFSAGHDLNEFANVEDLDFLARDFANLAALMQTIVAQPQIVIAKVEGVATAAGLELVAACDLALASTVARFAVPGVNIGFWCHTPQIQLSRAVGRKQAFEMLVTGQLYPAEHALRIGLVNALHEPQDLDAAIDELCMAIVSKAGAVLRRGKASFNAQASLTLDGAYEFCRIQALENIVEPDAREGIAAFLQKRKADWHS